MRPALAALVVARTCCGDLRAASRAAILHTLGHCDAATRDGAAPRPGLGFVHIGAHHWFPPTRDAMLHDVATRHNWTGLLVEPSPHVFEELQRRVTTTASPHVPVQAALCARSAPAVPFYAVSPTAIAADDMPSWITEIGSLRSDHARGHQGILGREIPVEQIEVECLGWKEQRKERFDLSCAERLAEAARAKAAGTLAQVPQDGLEVGQDINGAVGGYQAPNRFSGQISGVTIRLAK